MKALLCERWAHYSELKLVDAPKPVLKPGQVRIAVSHATAGFGQTLVVAGKYQRRPPLPFVPGTEVAGVVREVASDVTAFKPGDRVVAALDWGGYAEEAVATALTTWPVPDGVDLADAVNVPLSYGTSYAALHWRARIRSGETLIVFGAAGGVGLAAVAIGKAAGARVIAVAGSQERIDLAIRHGAAEGVIHGSGDLGRQLKELSGGRGADIVFDPVGGLLFDQALKCTAPEGRILVIGFASGTIPQIPANLLLVKNIEVIGFNLGLYIGWTPVDERVRHAARMAEMVQTLFALIRRGELPPLHADQYPLEDFVRAFDTVVARRSTGRVVLKISS
ncbi:NADPH:quinone oxidoreductase family protein [Bradyrhizobium sp. LHD-71]|uniref:NADPH:quinone oxidoreductase family protein n=1 Tax=Bradyrhizobium sp. LHD-71 TaxID=3072141 RepID=UPI00280C5681|nr:NADPH:quinone oxidoreductase family protein [Bradyrhizobium sp. LHD-71]MDQ8732797.1 NADPH:quinone oxidoreductase family protein [Bradyrhizobium sp. LHD-71]